MITTLATLGLLGLLPLANPSGRSADLTVAELEELRDEVIEQVEELRGGEFEQTVEVRVTTKAGFIEYAQDRSDRMQSAEERAADEDVAKLLGLIPTDMDLEATMFEAIKDQVGGFYEPTEKTFYVVSSFDEPGVLRVILVHELTHALDDQLFGIDEILLPLAKVNSDAALAFHAVVEGCGTTIMNQWMLPRLEKREISMAEMKKAAGSGGLDDVPEYIWMPLVHSYLRGAAFLAKSESIMVGQTAKPAPEDLDRAFESPPLSTEQVLHPEKYWDEELRDDPHRIEFDSTKLSAGWSILKEDTLGELGLALFTHKPDDRGGFNPMAQFTRRAAEGWGGDRYLLLGKGDARVLHVATSWDSAEDADEFEAALESLTGHLESGATELGDGTGGFAWRTTEQSDEVRFTVWSGVDDSSAKEVVKSLRATVVSEG